MNTLSCCECARIERVNPYIQDEANMAPEKKKKKNEGEVEEGAVLVLFYLLYSGWAFEGF